MNREMKELIHVVVSLMISMLIIVCISLYANIIS